MEPPQLSGPGQHRDTRDYPNGRKDHRQECQPAMERIEQGSSKLERLCRPEQESTEQEHIKRQAEISMILSGEELRQLFSRLGVLRVPYAREGRESAENCGDGEQCGMHPPIGYRGDGGIIVPTDPLPIPFEIAVHQLDVRHPFGPLVAPIIRYHQAQREPVIGRRVTPFIP